MVEMKIDASEIKNEGKEVIKELADFLKEKTNAEVTTEAEKVTVKGEGEAVSIARAFRYLQYSMGQPSRHAGHPHHAGRRADGAERGPRRQRRDPPLSGRPSPRLPDIGALLASLSDVDHDLHPGIPVDPDGPDRRAPGAHVPRVPGQADLRRPQSHPARLAARG